MTKSSQLTISHLPLAMNYRLAISNNISAASLLPSLQIVNCKLLITADQREDA